MTGPVLHVDMDAFYASCEELRDPSLADRPMAIGWDPRDGHGRGVVVAANYPARAFGVRSAMPAAEAVRRCPAIRFVLPDHDYYWGLSRRLFDALARELPIRPASVDEAYIDAGDHVGWDTAETFAQRIRARVADLTGGLPCSVGIGPNRLVAKVATDHQKPRGTTIVRPEDVRWFLDPLPVQRIPGIGPKTAARLGELEIQTVRQLRMYPAVLLQEHLGPHALGLQQAAAGQDAWSGRDERESHHSIGAERTLQEDTRHRPTLMGWIRRLVGRLEQELEDQGYWFRSVALKVRYSDFTTHTKQAGLARPSSDTAFARRMLPRLLDGLLADPRPVRLIGVRFQDVTQVRGQRTLAPYVRAPA